MYMIKPFTLITPESPLPLIFDSPHSGRDYPDDFGYACDLEILRQAEDNYVDELFAAAPDHSAALLCAHFPRSYIDVNRAEHDIDTSLLAGEWMLGPIRPTARSDAGIGLIRRLVKPGVAVYDRTLTHTEIVHRLEHYYHSYHKALESFIEQAHHDYGQVFHINCHSMPDATAFPKHQSGDPAQSVDFCIGDRDGRTSGIGFRMMVRDALRDMGYSVSINDPFKGVEVIRRTGRPTRGRQALQLEINKALYMSEETLEKTAEFAKLKADMDTLIGQCADYVEAQLMQQAAD